MFAITRSRLDAATVALVLLVGAVSVCSQQPAQEPPAGVLDGSKPDNVPSSMEPALDDVADPAAADLDPATMPPTGATPAPGPAAQAPGVNNDLTGNGAGTTSGGPFSDPAAAPPALHMIPWAQPRSAGQAALFQDHWVVTPALPVAQLLLEDAQVDGSAPLRMGVVQDIAAQAATGGWTELPDGGWLWTLAVTATGAKAVRVRVQGWPPLPGADLVVYAPENPEYALGPLTAGFQANANPLWTPTVYGDTALLELHVAPGVDREAATAHLRVDGVLNQYRALPSDGGAPPIDELPCHLDVTCYPSWAGAAAGVGALSYVNNPFGYFCSGAMLNRSPSDLTPMFMTAFHCGVNAGAAPNLLVTWFYQTSVCNGTPPNPNTLPQTQGVVLLAADVGLDWTLVGMSTANLGGVTFEGWDAGHFADNSSAISISHPQGTYKRIAFATKINDSGSTPDPAHPPSCMGSNHTYVQFSQGNGRIEPGSSGSPLFDSSQRVRGTLSCGSTPQCAGTEDGDYGRLDQMWPELAPYLQPVDPVYVNGFYAGFEAGTVAQPFITVLKGSFAVRAASNVYIQADSYNEHIRINKAMTLHALNGVATIGR